MPMTEQAAEARREYKRKWYAKNRDKQRDYTERYWEKKAAEDTPTSDSKGQETEESGEGGGE